MRSLVRPKWIAGHVLALVAVVGFINLGFWQLRRLDERRDLNRIIAARMAEPATPLAELLAEFGADPEALEFRRVEVSGSYLLDEEVLWQARTLRGRSGHDVLTPLLVDPGAVIVNRGWVPIDASDPPVDGAEPPSVDVMITGVIRPGHVRGRLGPVDPQTGDLDRVSRIDITRLQVQIDPRLYPFYVLLEGQVPEQSSGFPMPQTLLEQSEGRHLSYAIQWFLFSAIVAIGYPMLLRRTVRDERKRSK